MRIKKETLERLQVLAGQKADKLSRLEGSQNKTKAFYYKELEKVLKQIISYCMLTDLYPLDMTPKKKKGRIGYSVKFSTSRIKEFYS